VIGGKQWVSWIHIDDEVGLILFALTHDSIRGPVNSAAPNPVPMRAFSQEIGHALHRPVWAPVPAALIRTVLGEQGNVILGSIRLQPKVAQDAGYHFQYPELGGALHEALD
jgi:NAD dependent epimerase/dehydratase family enzyme